jgi:hypothetical protein
VIKASIDRPKLEKSLKRFSQKFGETNAQAVVRWGVQTCRDLAMETQVFGRNASNSGTGDGKGLGPKAIQQRAILRDAYNVLFVAKTMKSVHWKKGTGFLIVMEKGKNPFNVPLHRVLNSPLEVNWWVDMHRTRRRARTAKIPATERKFCSQQVFKKAMADRFKNVGMAKGGWIGAGKEIARAQTGMNRIDIGKNYLSYTHKFARYGSAKKPVKGWTPAAYLTNRVRHVAASNVLKPTQIDKSIQWGLVKTVAWYRAAVRNIDRSQKP